MSFLVAHPFIPTLDKSSSQSMLHLAWQELEILSFKDESGAGKYIQQAKCYFIDAERSDWRSGGLLYYYSFLNLAKALLVHGRHVTQEEVSRSRGYHGLNHSDASGDTLPAFAITIHPPKGSKDSINFFARLYEAILGESWPFTEAVTISLRDTFGYSFEIGDELNRVYGIGSQASTSMMWSLVRLVRDRAFYECIIFSRDHSKFCDLAQKNGGALLLSGNTLDVGAKSDWFASHAVTTASLNKMVILRGPENKFLSATEQGSAIQQSCQQLNDAFGRYALPTVSQETPPTWLVVHPIKIGDKTLRWHPLLTDYLVAFALSTLLRYRPFQIDSDAEDGFIARAWCRQAPISTLRYFVWHMTPDRVRCNPR